MDIGQSKVSSSPSEGESFVVDAQQVKDRRVQVMHGDDILYRPITKFIGCSMAVPPLYPSSSQPNRESLRVVVAAFATLSKRRPPKLAREHQQGRVKQSSSLEIRDQGCDWLIDHLGISPMSRFDVFVVVPRGDEANPFDTSDLHKTYPAFH